ESQVARWAGIDTSLKTGDITTCYQYRMANLRTEPDYCEFILGSAAPGGYIWIFPKGDDTANVGIGVLASKLKKAGEVKRYLDAWIKKDERLSCGQPLEAVAGGVSVSPPVERSVMSGLMLVGDAARIIDPITGGGIANGLLSGKYAGEVLGDCAQANDYSEQALMPYDKRWRDSMENRLWRNWMAKEKFLTLSDQTLDGVIETLSTANVDKMSVHNILRAIKDRHPDLVKEFEDLI
ncbi:MAG TPA: NAD(P)/FAD-dependent oxidoreductase, partial [Methanomassiliicoccales archaeon]|nr:NAD(P)/FAD-dependent oxidoreductase [Methanomassiliicoccales archaeon]